MTTKVALVTNVHEFGGPGAVAALTGLGMRVACHDTRFAEQEARHAYGGQHDGVDARPEQEPGDLVQGVLDDHGRLDVVVSNDIAPFASPFSQATVEDYRRLLEALAVRPFALAKAAVPDMLRRGSGSLIFITSATAQRPVPGTALYGAARAATTMLAAALPKELWGSGIQVNAIGPHWMSNPTYFPEGWDTDDRRRERFEREVPMQRLGRQEELGALVGLLASGAAAPVTGQFIGFTGGWLP